MKHLKLKESYRILFTLIAFAVGAFSFNANAQADYNFEYDEGVEVTTGGDFFLYNIGQKQFLTGGMDWGSHAATDHAGKICTLAVLNDGYSIYTDYYSRNGLDNFGFLTSVYDSQNDIYNPYTDTGSNGIGAEWVFSPVDVQGYTHAYTIKNGDNYLYANQADTRVNLGSNTDDEYSYWILVPRSAREARGDCTYYIQNTDFNRFWERACWAGCTWGNEKFATGGLASNPCSEKYHAALDLYQTLTTDLPEEGRYKLYAQGFYRQDDNKQQDAPVLYMNDDKKELAVFNANNEGTAANMNGASTSFSAGKYVNSVETFVSSDNLKPKLGINITGANQWVIWDNFTLEYLGQVVMDYAEEELTLGVGKDMVAGTWYYFDIPVEGVYNLNATTLSDITYTTDGYTLKTTVPNDSWSDASPSLAKGRYYIKSSSAQTLTISVADYTYIVGSASADASCIQTGKTVTVSYPDKETNDLSATFAYDHTKAITFNNQELSITVTDDGFTFVVPTVEAGQTYTLSIPAGAFGYEAGSNYNVAEEITFSTPAVFDGTYFLKVENETDAKGKYLSRGKNYGTHATLDAYGLPIEIKTNAQGQTTLSPADTKRFYYHGNQWDMWADAGSVSDAAYYTISKEDNTYKIHSLSQEEGRYLKYNTNDENNANISVYDDGTGQNSGPIISWSIESLDDHATVMANLKNAQAQAAATAAGLENVTTVSGLENAVESLIEGPFVAATEISSVKEKFQGGQPASGNVVETVYSNTIHITTSGLYKFSMQAFYRAGSNEVTQALHTAGADFPPVTLFFGSAETQIKSLYDEEGSETQGAGDVQYNGKYYANNMDGALRMFQDGKYHNDVWLYISEPGEYSYGVKYMGFANGNAQWFIYSPESVTITSYSSPADDDDYAALNDAIAAAEAKTLGFANGEYAPYNNVDAIAAITTAKDINQNETNSKLYVQSQTALLGNWTANTEEVNAIAYGDLSQYETIDSKDYPWGWSKLNDESRIMGGSEGTNNTGLSASSTGKAMLVKYDATYGETEGYTMPLNANTYYKISFKYCGWGNMPTTNVLMTCGEEIIEVGSFKPETNDGYNDAEHWYLFEKVFKTGEAGNYVLAFNKVESNQQQIAWCDMSIYSYEPATQTLTLASSGYRTAVTQYDCKFDIEGIRAFIVEEEGIDTDTWDIQMTEITSAKAGTPVILYGEPNLEFSLTETLDEVDDHSGTNMLQGGTNETVGDDYGLIWGFGGGVFKKMAATATLNPERAYLVFYYIPTLPEDASFRADFGDGEANAINGIVDETAAPEGIYNLQGQKVSAPVKGGIYIINGKKTLVK